MYQGEPTIDQPTPIIEDTAPTPGEPTAYQVAPLGNRGETASTNTTFLLNTNTTTPAGENKVMQLHQKTNSNSALIVIEANEDATPGAILARFWMDGSLPDPNKGLPLKDCSVFEVIGASNIKNFRIISADDLAHKVQVQYIM